MAAHLPKHIPVIKNGETKCALHTVKPRSVTKCRKLPCRFKKIILSQVQNEAKNSNNETRIITKLGRYYKTGLHTLRLDILLRTKLHMRIFETCLHTDGRMNTQTNRFHKNDGIIQRVSHHLYLEWLCFMGKWRTNRESVPNTTNTYSCSNNTHNNQHSQKQQQQQAI